MQNEYRCFEVEGKSMFPSYHDGDYVICSHIPNVYLEQALKNLKPYVVVTQQSVFLKRLENHLKQTKSIKLISENKNFEEFELLQDQIIEIWKVEGVISTRDFSFHPIS
jgi:phage repressor protein C with HTH and peptisase S24 domain